MNKAILPEANKNLILDENTAGKVKLVAVFDLLDNLNILLNPLLSGFKLHDMISYSLSGGGRKATIHTTHILVAHKVQIDSIEARGIVVVGCRIERVRII